MALFPNMYRGQICNLGMGKGNVIGSGTPSASRTKAKASGNNSSSVVPLCARDFNSSVKAPFERGNRQELAMAWQLLEGFGFFAKDKNSWIFCMFSNKIQIIQLMY